MDEAQAVDLVLNNSLEGLAWLVERFQLKALRAAFLITRDRQLAEDVLQEKFLQLPGNLHLFDKTWKFEPWFLQSVVNAAIRCVSRGRCVKGAFAAGDPGQTGAKKITLTIPGLEKSLPEAYLDEQLLPVLETLCAEGIDISVYSSSASGGGGGGWTVHAKPQGMTDDEAYQRLLELQGCVRSGPWVFAVETDSLQ